MKKALLLSLLTTISTSLMAITPSEKAIRIAQENPIVDTHIDVPYRIAEEWDDVTVATNRGDFDYPRAVQGGLNALFMSIYIPASYEKSGGGAQLANQLIDSVEAIAGRAPDKFEVAYSTDDVLNAFKHKRIAMPMGMENGTPIAGDLNNLKHFYKRGVRYITLAHSLSNHISDSSYDLRRQWKGLSPFGKELVKAMNDIGMMIDISHVSDDAFYQTLEITQVPVIASHSSLRKFTPGFERNMDDDMLKALAKNGGVIQINFGSSFVNSIARNWYTQRTAKIEELGLTEKPEEQNQFKKKYRNDNPFPYATLDNVLDHVDHVKKVVGIDYVGIGSDFDGVGDSLPRDLKDVSYYPHFVQGLLDRGYTEAEIIKVLNGNIMRVWKQVEDFAKR